MILVDSVKISENGFSYLDDGRFNNTALDDKLIYCYALTTVGGYDNPILPSPLVNNSQIVSAQPNDNIAPCAPIDETFLNFNNIKYEIRDESLLMYIILYFISYNCDLKNILLH